jgi:hypothetical protein
MTISVSLLLKDNISHHVLFNPLKEKGFTYEQKHLLHIKIASICEQKHPY